MRRAVVGEAVDAGMDVEEDDRATTAARWMAVRGSGRAGENASESHLHLVSDPSSSFHVPVPDNYYAMIFTIWSQEYYFISKKIKQKRVAR